MDQIKIGAFIAALRREKSWTQEELGVRLGVTNKTVSRWETGRYMPDIETLILLGREFGVSLNELVQGQRLEAEDTFRAAADENLSSALRRPLARLYRWLDRHTSSIILFLVMALLLGAACLLYTEYRHAHPADVSLHGTFRTGPITDSVYLTFQEYDGTFLLHRQGEPLSLGTYSRQEDMVTLTDDKGEETSLLVKGSRLYAPTEDARFVTYEKCADIPYYVGLDAADLGLFPPAGTQWTSVSQPPSQWPFPPPADPTYIN